MAIYRHLDAVDPLESPQQAPFRVLRAGTGFTPSWRGAITVLLQYRTFWNCTKVNALVLLLRLLILILLFYKVKMVGPQGFEL